MTHLRAVLFDIDDTLFGTTDFAGRARRNAVHAMCNAGLDLPPEAVECELAEVIAEFSSNYDQHFNKLLVRLASPLREGASEAVVVAAGVCAYHDTKFRDFAPFPDVIPLLADLKAGGVTTGIITHGLTTKQAEKLVRLGVVPHLDSNAIFISEEIGISKPNPKLYETALARLGLAAAEVMYVGDSPAHDIAPPKSLGMVTAWARRASKWTPKDESQRATHEIDDFDELRSILHDTYEVAIWPRDLPLG
jgi:putative hydrolase of the HAD superfamily